MAGASAGCLFVVTRVVVAGRRRGGACAFFYQQTRFADARSPRPPRRGHRQRRWHGSSAPRKRDAGVDEGQDTQWQLLARQLDAAGKLKVGEYALSGELTRASCCCACAPARCCSTITIVEGWNIRQLRAALKRAEPRCHRQPG